MGTANWFQNTLYTNVILQTGLSLRVSVGEVAAKAWLIKRTPGWRSSLMRFVHPNTIILIAVLRASSVSHSFVRRCRQ